MSKRKLTAKQEGFVKDFLETKNASEAVRRNYDVVSASPQVIAAIGSENLDKPNIREKIAQLKDQFVTDSYNVYDIQKKILAQVSAKPHQFELANKIANKILDRAGFTPTHKSENKSMHARFVITRGNEAQEDTSISSPTNNAVIAE